MSGRPVREILASRGFSFEKKFGQNFLTDSNLLSAIARESGAAEFPVLEIGCGAGTLTDHLARISPKVLGYEIDARLKDVLGETLADHPNVSVVYEDFLKADLSEIESRLGGDYVVCANLPYYITTPVLMKLLEESRHLRALTLMVQEEVALRLIAEPGTPEYGAVTVAVALAGKAEIVRRVGRKMFLPPPNVDSAVVRITLQRQPGFSDEAVRKLARSAFAMRRKTLSNNLVSALGIPRETAVRAIVQCGFSESVRGERLSAEDFVRLTEALRRLGALPDPKGADGL